MSTHHSLIRVLSEFDSRVHELTAALAAAAGRHSPSDVSKARQKAPAMALRMASIRRLWFATPVPLEALLHARNRVAIVTAAALRPLLAARALFDCRDAIRRCVDRETRRALALSIGPAAFAALQERALTHPSAQPLPADLSADALAREGWALMLADGACANATLRQLVELGLEAASGGDVWQRALMFRQDASVQVESASRQSTNASGCPTSTDEFLSIAGLLFPECQWLFG
jgi:hypothetical protein